MNSFEKTSVSIIGCGWVGKALAKDLIDQGVDVLGTTRSREKQIELTGLGISSELMNLPDVSEAFVDHRAFKNNILIIAITPGFKRGETDYADKVSAIVKAVQANKDSKVKQIILLSSTGVYQGLTGPVDEDSTLATENNKVALLNQAEQAVLSFNTLDKTKSASVLRLAGLVGPDRHPGRFLAGKKQLPNPKHAVHLIHQKDVIGIILRLIENPKISGVFNAVSATQSTRQLFYRLATDSLSLAAPEFADDTLVADKHISSDKLRTRLSYEFEYDDLIEWLNRESALLS